MKRLPLFLCIIFYACGTNDEPDNNPAVGLDSSSSVMSSSSLENSSSSVELGGPKLSKNELYFNEQGGIDSLVIIGAGLYGRGVYGGYDANNEECKYIRADHLLQVDKFNTIFVQSDYCKENYCLVRHDVIRTDSNHAPLMKVECSWYSLAYTSENSLSVSVNKNETGKGRSIYIGLFAGDYYGVGFTITQSARL